MKKSEKKNLLIGSIFLAMFAVWTALIQSVDVQPLVQKWICNIQLLVSPFHRGKHGNLYDYRLDGAGACRNMPYFRRDWTCTVDQKKKPFQGGCRYHDFGCVFCHRVLGICDF